VCYNNYRKRGEKPQRKKEVISMTLYEKNYKERLDEMLDIIVCRYGHEDARTVTFAIYVEKYYNDPNYVNRETMERIFKGYTNNFKKK
jgi:hypothetical protein